MMPPCPQRPDACRARRARHAAAASPARQGFSLSQGSSGRLLWAAEESPRRPPLPGLQDHAPGSQGCRRAFGPRRPASFTAER